MAEGQGLEKLRDSWQLGNRAGDQCQGGMGEGPDIGAKATPP